MRRLGILLLFTFGLAYGQSLWIETGLGYLERLPDNNERPNQTYDSGFKVGARVIFPLPSSRVGIYLAPYLQFESKADAESKTYAGMDAGAWFTLPLNIQDIEGFTSYIGTGLSVTALATDNIRFGFALSAALSYDLSNDVALALVYTHRPLLTPKLSQAFDISVGLRFDLQ
jgi:hypothetical protein